MIRDPPAAGYRLPAGVTPQDHVRTRELILTEKWVNSRYKIDYQRGPNDRLRLVFHRDRPGNLYHLRTQFYVPAAWFSPLEVERAPPREEGTREAKPTPCRSRPCAWSARPQGNFADDI